MWETQFRNPFSISIEAYGWSPSMGWFMAARRVPSLQPSGRVLREILNGLGLGIAHGKAKGSQEYGYESKPWYRAVNPKS